MELKKTKRPIMGLSAFLIILFHFYPIPMGGDPLSLFARFIIMTAYIGVDIFFFMAAYMSYFSDVQNYKAYIKRKFTNIYPIFILSSLVFLLMGGFNLGKMFKTLIGLELVQRGGGSLLWFLPSIMIFYLFAPILKAAFEGLGHKKALAISLLLWLIAILLLEKTLRNHSINIFLNRIPIILIGLALAKYEAGFKRKTRLLIGFILLILGIYLTQKYAFMIKRKILITDSFYVIAIPYIMGSILILDVIFSRFSSYFFDSLGKISLEIYASQMVLGPYLIKIFSKVTKCQILIFFLVFLSLAAISFFLNFVSSKLKIRQRR